VDLVRREAQVLHGFLQSRKSFFDICFTQIHKTTTTKMRFTLKRTAFQCVCEVPYICLSHWI
jgi:hypothetical protein